MTTSSSPTAVSWIGEMTPGWLTDVLRAGSVIDGGVQHVEIKPLEVGSAG